MQEMASCGFAIGAGHADDDQFARRVIVKGCRQKTKELLRILDAKVGDRKIQLFRFTGDCRGAVRNCVRDETMAVCRLARSRDEEATRFNISARFDNFGIDPGRQVATCREDLLRRDISD